MYFGEGDWERFCLLDRHHQAHVYCYSTNPDKLCPNLNPIASLIKHQSRFAISELLNNYVLISSSSNISRHSRTERQPNTTCRPSPTPRVIFSSRPWQQQGPVQNLHNRSPPPVFPQVFVIMTLTASR